MTIFATRLKECRKNINKTQREVADFLGITTVGYQNYELSKNEPKVSVLNKISDYFDVSADYLMGRSDIPKHQ